LFEQSQGGEARAPFCQAKAEKCQELPPVHFVQGTGPKPSSSLSREKLRG
jgi:hypothetical protein